MISVQGVLIQIKEVKKEVKSLRTVLLTIIPDNDISDEEKLQRIKERLIN